MEFSDIANSIHPLNKKDLETLIQLVEKVSIKKNSHFIESDKYCPYIYFQKTGICRVYYHKEEKEVVLAFSFPGEVILSLNSYVYHTKGYEDIQALEDSELYQLRIKDLEQLYNQHVGIANWGRKLAEIEALKIEERLMLRLFRSSKESYDELMKKAPNITNRIKLGYIASYLGITQVTLSRIRGIKK